MSVSYCNDRVIIIDLRGMKETKKKLGKLRVKNREANERSSATSF